MLYAEYVALKCICYMLQEVLSYYFIKKLHEFFFLKSLLFRLFSLLTSTSQGVELRKKLFFSTVIWTHFFGLFSPLLPHRSKPSCAQRGTLLWQVSTAFSLGVFYIIGKKKKDQLFLIQILLFLTQCCSQVY